MSNNETRRRIMSGGLSASIAAYCVSRARAASTEPLRVGVLNDQSGPYSAVTGVGSVIAARMAIQDFGGTVLGRPIELLVADHQNKADIGAGIARGWADQSNFGLIMDIAHSAVALAVQQIVKDKNKIAIYTFVGSSLITGENCSPNGFSWVYNAYALCNGLVAAETRTGSKNWFLLVVDYAFGHSLEAETRAAVARIGGRVVGSARHPEGNNDFGSYILQAIASDADILALCNAGGDMINSLKQAREFGFLEKDKQVAVPIMPITDVQAVGLNQAEGLTSMTAFYWDRNDASRQFGERFLQRHPAAPSEAQAAVYSGLTHYLKAVAAAGVTDTAAVLAKMRELPVHDFYTENGWLRADGRLMHDFYLVKVKSPSASKRPWDYFDVLSSVSADRAFEKASESSCPLLRA